jgi:hypothetical protein
MNNGITHKLTMALLACAVTAVLALPAAAAASALEPTKWELTWHVGRSVNETKIKSGAPQEERNECTIASKDTCRFGEEGTGLREFAFPASVAVSKLTGNVYVSDEDTHRVEALEPEGGFISMFGWKVNKTTGGNICTEEEIQTTHVECGVGEKGTGLAGQQAFGDLAVDPTTGDVYFLDVEYHRVEEYTAAGEFVLMFGGHVNKNGGNLCTKAEEIECQAGVEGSSHGAFANLYAQTSGNLLTFGPEGLLYVGDEGRVQKFEADGTWVGQLELTGLPVGQTKGVAIDAAGDVFVADSATTGIHEYNASEELQACVIDPAGELIHGMALDSADMLAITEEERISGLTVVPRALVFDTQGVGCGKQIGEIAPPSGSLAGFPAGLAFSFNETGGNEDRLYIANDNLQEIEGYLPVLFPTVATCPTTSVTFTSALLCGEVNPIGVATTAFFKYGTDPHNLSSRTPVAFAGSGTMVEPVEYQLAGLVPNEVYWDEAYAEANGEQGGGPPAVSFHTATPPPAIEGAPSASDVTDAFALLSASLNPEHAPARYHFEYGPCSVLAGCTGVVSTPVEESSVYGSIGAIQEVVGLQPQTGYSYRLVADNRHEEPSHAIQGGETVGAEGHFTTGAAPVPNAQTGSASAITATSATIAGLADPDGQPAVYAFELGVYNGANTQYGIVFSGPAGASATPVAESIPVSGLQAGTTYAYRIVVTSGYGEALGATATFTTAGLPAALAVPSPPAILAVPNIVFPAVGTVTKTRLPHGKKTKKRAKKGRRSRAGRHAAQRSAKKKTKQ